jgi:hypothetical protein
MNDNIEHDQECFICNHECKKANLCSCKEGNSFVHIYCICDWILLTNNYICTICQTPYKLSYYFRAYIYCNKLIKTIISYNNFITKYDIVNAAKFEYVQ